MLQFLNSARNEKVYEQFGRCDKNKRKKYSQDLHK